MSAISSISPTDLVVITVDQSAKCAGCHLPLAGEQLAFVANKLFHSNCIKCSECQSILIDSFAGSTEKPYCGDCYARKYPSMCDGKRFCLWLEISIRSLSFAGCGEPLTGKVCLEFRGKRYHRVNCVKCVDCRQPFKNSQCYLFADEACCLDCYWRRRLNPS